MYNSLFTAFFAVLALGLVSMIVFLVFRVKYGGLKGLLTKFITSIVFILTAIAAYAASDAPEQIFPYFIFAGLVFGLMGDVWLDLKWVYPADNDFHTNAGFVSFSIQHVFIIAGLLLCYADFTNILSLVIPLVVAVVFGVGVIAMEKPMKLEYGKFKTISMIYCMILVLVTALCCSFAITAHFENMTMNLMSVGYILFLISDLILSGTYFGEGKDKPLHIILNHVFYYLGQFTIASALLFIA